jgi:two-component system nitrate/nitrite response regulator NarL
MANAAPRSAGAAARDRAPPIRARLIGAAPVDRDLTAVFDRSRCIPRSDEGGLRDTGQPKIAAEGVGVVSVLVIADVRLYREGLVHAIGHRDEVEVVGTAASSQDAVLQFADLRPDVVLVDVATTDGLSAVRGVVESVPNARVVAVASPETESDVIAYAEAGASGYVPRNGGLADLRAVIMSAARGEALISPRVTAGLLRRLADLASSDGRTAPAGRLTPREAEILELIDQGLSNKQIARRLSIAVSTVKNHVHSILDKLQVERRGEAVARLSGTRRGERTAESALARREASRA